jgi:hypothetical protein
MIFDSIDNHGEYFSNHYLDVLLQGDLAGLRSRCRTDGRTRPSSRASGRHAATTS